MVKSILLQNGLSVIIDDEDYERVNKFNWSFSTGTNKTTFNVKTAYQTTTHIYLSEFLLGKQKGKKISHLNGDKLDYRKNNLFFCTQDQITYKSKSRIGSTSKYKGVSWDKRIKKWVASIHKNGKKHHLGCFYSENEAAEIYNDAAKVLFGELAYQNVIGEDNTTQFFEEQKNNRNFNRKQSKTTTSIYKGVSFDKRSGKWACSTTIDGKFFWLGRHNQEKEAAKAYDQKAKEVYGDAAILNLNS